MSSEAWIALGIFVVSQYGALAGIVFVLRGDTKLLRVQLTDVREELKKLSDVVTQVAVQNARLDNFESRQILSGQRLDGLETRLNRFTDVYAIPGVSAARDR